MSWVRQMLRKVQGKKLASQRGWQPSAVGMGQQQGEEINNETDGGEDLGKGSIKHH